MDLVKALRECYSTLAAAHEVLMDVRKGKAEINAEGWKVIEEHNLEALNVGQETLEEIDRIRNGAEDSLKIAKWLSPGELQYALTDEDEDEEPPELPETIQELYELVGAIIDSQELSDTLGTLIFQGENGKYYEMSLEGVLNEAHPDSVCDFLPPEEEKPDAETSPENT